MSTLKNKSSEFNRWGREIEFLFEDENELLAEMETTTDFDHNASITVARLSALINNYQKSLESMNNPPRYESSGGNTSKLKLLKMDLPHSQTPTRIGCLSLICSKGRYIQIHS